MNRLDMLGPKFSNSLGAIFLMVLFWVTTAAPVSAQNHRLNVEEMSLFKRISSNAAQQRETVKLDPILCIDARKRAADMAHRNYFSHIDPSGQGPNLVARRAGFEFPPYYDSSRSGNNIESIGMATSGPNEVFSQWLQSSFHRSHVLGEHDFYLEQSAVGVGVYRSPKAPYYKYIVFLSAPPNAALLPRIATLKNPKGEIIATTRPLNRMVNRLGAISVR